MHGLLNKIILNSILLTSNWRTGSQLKVIKADNPCDPSVSFIDKSAAINPIKVRVKKTAAVR